MGRGVVVVGEGGQGVMVVGDEVVGRGTGSWGRGRGQYVKYVQHSVGCLHEDFKSGPGFAGLAESMARTGGKRKRAEQEC